MHGAQCLCSTQVEHKHCAHNQLSIQIILNTQSYYWTLIDGLLCYSLANKAKNARVASTASELDEKSEDTQSSSTASRWLQDSYYF